jgi:hypothetical protein
MTPKPRNGDRFGKNSLGSNRKCHWNRGHPGGCDVCGLPPRLESHPTGSAQAVRRRR